MNVYIGCRVWGEDGWDDQGLHQDGEPPQQQQHQAFATIIGDFFFFLVIFFLQLP